MRLIRLAAAAAALAVSAPPAAAQDANAVLQRMYTAYSTLKSYTHTAGSTLTRTIDGGRPQPTGLTSELRFARPNKAYVAVTSPQIGTSIAASDGRGLICYNSGSAMYTKAPAPASLGEFVAAARQVGIASELDPLQFLQGVKTNLTGLTMRAPTTVNGVQCHVVGGRFTSAKLVPGRSGTVTLYIDKSTSLVRKVSLSFTGIQGNLRTAARKGGKVVQTTRRVKLDQTIVTVIQKLEVNGATPDSAFKFAPPPGSFERKK